MNIYHVGYVVFENLWMEAAVIAESEENARALIAESQAEASGIEITQIGIALPGQRPRIVASSNL